MQIFKRYMREGPGVPPNLPPKRGIALYFELIGRKFLKLIRANFLYFLFSLPVFLVLLLFVTPLYTAILLPAGYNGDEFGRVLLDLFFTFLIFNFIGSGPLSASYSHIIKSFIRGQYIWILSDGFDKFRENFKNSVLLIITDIIVFVLFAVAINYYKNSSALLSVGMLYFLSLMLIFYIISHAFAYQVMVNFECKFRHIIKNAFIFTLAKLPLCILIAFGSAILLYVLFNYLNIFGILIYVTVGMSFIKIPLEFYASETIRRYIEEQK